MAAARRRARADALLETPFVLTLEVDIDDLTRCPRLEIQEQSKVSPISCTCEILPTVAADLIGPPEYSELRPGKHRLRVICHKAEQLKVIMERYHYHAQSDADLRPHGNQVGDLVVQFGMACDNHGRDSGKSWSKPEPVFDVFTDFRTKRRKPGLVNKDLIKKIKTPITPQDPTEPDDYDAGHIYIMQHPTQPSYLKIGVAKNPPVRAASLVRCYPKATMLAYTNLVPHAHRVESLVHAELALLRQKETCGNCEKVHGEWFEADLDVAREAVKRWAGWILTWPYRPNDGKLKDSWDLHTEKTSGLIPGVAQAQDKCSWQTWVDVYPLAEVQELPDWGVWRGLEITVF